jgi:hypothetical protein
MNNLKLKKFDPTKIGDERICCVIGKRGTGKSTLVADIMYHKRHIPMGIVQSATEEGNKFYSKFVPDIFVYNDYSITAIEQVVARQKKLVSKNSPNPNCFLILDDCMHDRKSLKSPIIRQIFQNGRHWKIFMILTAQYALDMSPDLRGNVDFVFILRENIIQNRERLYKSYFGIFPTFAQFCQVMDACTENYEALVLDNTSHSNKIEECVYWYKAPIRTNFRVGSEIMWNYHNRNYKPAISESGTEKVPPVKQVLKITKTL